MTETIVLGLDGATWDLLDPLIEAGEVPNLASLVGAGHRGTLESTVPPVTAPAWTSMATGLNPGETGVYSFLRRTDPDDYEFDPVDSGVMEGRSLWDYLSAAGHSVGVFNFPLLYPPYELDGYAVSGFPAPEDGEITHPPDLLAELEDVTGGYRIEVPYAAPKYADRPGALAADLRAVVEKRGRAIEHLLATRPTDHFFGVVSATDWAQHYFWRAGDPSLPPSAPGSHDCDGDPPTEAGSTRGDPSGEESTHGEALAGVWRAVDEVVGTVAGVADRREATLLLVSDHGFGPTRRTFNATEWLERRGYLVRPESPLDRLRTEYFAHLRRVGEAVARAVPPLSDALERVGRRLRGDQGRGIDFERSVAFAPRENLGYGLLYVLDDDRREDLVADLRDLADDAGVDLDLARAEEVYSGAAVDLAPDLLFALDGLACDVDARPAPGSDLFEDGPPSAARSANHRPEGIYVLAGDGVEPPDGDGDRGDPGSRGRATLLDVAPTVLAAHGVAVPEAMEGDPLPAALASGVVDAPVRRAPLGRVDPGGRVGGATDREAGNGDEGTDADGGDPGDPSVERRLEDLGYR